MCMRHQLLLGNCLLLLAVGGQTSPTAALTHMSKSKARGRDFQPAGCAGYGALKHQGWILRLGNTWLRYNSSHVTSNLASLHPLQHPGWGIPQPLKSFFFFFPFCQQGVGKTLPLSWVQGLRRISGPGFAWIGLQGSLGLLAAGQGLCSTGWCGGFLTAASCPDSISYF